MRPLLTLPLLLLAGVAAAQPAVVGQPVVSAPVGQGRWTPERAQAWYAAQPWIVGANFLPSTAINQLEMFQADTWDPRTIDRELALARSTGMNTVRVYLHDLLWDQDRAGFIKRIDEFLSIAHRHGIRPVLVLFDSCWDPDPQLGPQRRPLPGVHNSGWVQSPGRRRLVDRTEHPRLLTYVRGVVGRFAKDDRILVWDVWNEPDNGGGGSYEALQLPDEKAMVAELLPRAFAAAREAGATQPLTSGVWTGGSWAPDSATLDEIHRIQLAQSDVISFHHYGWPEGFEERIAELRRYGRPVLCTEWLARGFGSTVDMILPIAKRERVAVINWGLVDGDSQTRFPWDSWERPYVTRDPAVWHHDLFRVDGTPYRRREIELFRELTGRGQGTPAASTRR
ncbi:cellulase family glycosylhydrolase [Sphingomonas lenta]|uniref:1,4-beta-xylanase n=1 Tax=Sphingomonas lenta TaxID=1141887 RepID=A0A2A2SCP7_9SPHN|nr:cellulase family glycosylhydrolase [Sphingomonas lenta]PAX06952.1 1,4-beta-xylanase [Sphingomonas lenta]